MGTFPSKQSAIQYFNTEMSLGVFLLPGANLHPGGKGIKFASGSKGDTAIRRVFSIMTTKTEFSSCAEVLAICMGR